MKNLLKYPHLFLAVVLFTTSCKDDAPEVVDITVPVISNVQHPEAVEAGAVFLLKFTLIDDVGLGSVQIEIHDDFDAHGHENARKAAGTPFSYSNVLESMRGLKEYSVEEIINIPADANTGPYHLQISYLDAAGNEGVFYVGSFEIVSESRSPAISITNFGVNEELHPTINEDGTKVLYLEGGVVSKTAGGLAEVHIIVQHEEGTHSNGRVLHDGAVYDQEWVLGGATSFDFQLIEPVIDFTNAEVGHYELRILARDVEGNVKVVTREVHVE